MRQEAYKLLLATNYSPFYENCQSQIEQIIMQHVVYIKFVPLDNSGTDEEELEEIGRKNHSRNGVYSSTVKCHVCGEPAGRHNAYGGRVCPSCRAFFRRSVQSKYYEVFLCTKGERCEINAKTRRGCKFCRFQKCLRSGMRIAWVLSEGERNRRFNKLHKVAFRNNKFPSHNDDERDKKVKQEVEDRQLTPVAPRHNPIMAFTQEERK